MDEQTFDRPIRVLTIDDDPDMRIGVKVALEVEGYTVATAPNGAEGIDVAGNFLPDIIVLDVEMPGIGGPETLRRLRKDPQLEGIPVVFLTGKVDLDAMEETFEEIAQGYLLKPFSVIQLLNKIEEVLGTATE
ncbi:MAG TPA: response regulator [Candidatus Anoxymicrobiaceae bacterium]